MDRAAVNALEMEEPEHKLTPIVRIILESGLLNAAFLFAFVMTLVFGSTSLEIMSMMVRPPAALRCFPLALAQLSCARAGNAHVRDRLHDRHLPRRSPAQKTVPAPRYPGDAELGPCGGQDSRDAHRTADNIEGAAALAVSAGFDNSCQSGRSRGEQS